ncbi:MAG: Crp/Fnr family transcriptional regulator [Thiotrichales bacterium]
MNETLWHTHFPTLADAPDPPLAALLASARIARLTAGEFAFHRGVLCQNYLLVIAGRIKVSLTATSGREVTLYHVNPGESCVLTTTCLIGVERYPAEGLAETEVTALAIPRACFETTLDNSPRFRRFVFDNLGRRFADVLARMEQVHFGDIDSRLAAALLAIPHESGALSVTHQTLANELGTAREVVSRHLKYFESRGWVRLSRNRIELLDFEALRDASLTTP